MFSYSRSSTDLRGGCSPIKREETETKDISGKGELSFPVYLLCYRATGYSCRRHIFLS